MKKLSILMSACLLTMGAIAQTITVDNDGSVYVNSSSPVAVTTTEVVEKPVTKVVETQSTTVERSVKHKNGVKEVKKTVTKHPAQKTIVRDVETEVKTETTIIGK